MSVFRVLRLVRGQLPRLGFAALVAAAAELCGIALIATATWLLATAAQQPPLTALTVAIVGVRAFAIGRGVLRYLDRLVGHDAVLRALARLRGTVFKALTPLAPMGARLFRGGDLLTRFVSDVDAVQDLLLRVIVPVWTAAVVAVAAIGFTAVFSPGAALVLAGCVLVSGVLLPVAAALLAKRSARRTVIRRAALAASTMDLIHGSADLAAYGATSAAVKRGADDTAALAGAERTGAGLVAAVTAAHALVAGAGVIGVLLAAQGLGVMTAVLALTALVGFEALAPLPQAARRLAEVRSATDRIMAIMDAKPPVAEPEHPESLPEGEPRLVLTDAVPQLPTRASAMDADASGLGGAGQSTLEPGRQVRHVPDASAVGRTADATQSTPDTVPALQPQRGVSLDLPPGKRIAIVGASGAGKTMLLSMLVRFTNIAHGEVTLGGVGLESLRGNDVRTVVGGMLSDAHLFNTTVRDNLGVADPDATDATLRAALTRAGLPDLDLDIAVGEDGRALSGGQRQRLLLARALLGGHPILLLDEPTEHLDPETAAAVMADLVSATDGRSLLCVTHHLAHLDAFDEILVMESGSIAERGTYAELIERDGPFRQLAGTFAPLGATT